MACGGCARRRALLKDAAKRLKDRFVPGRPAPTVPRPPEDDAEVEQKPRGTKIVRIR